MGGKVIECLKASLGNAEGSEKNFFRYAGDWKGMMSQRGCRTNITDSLSMSRGSVYNVLICKPWTCIQFSDLKT